MAEKCIVLGELRPRIERASGYALSEREISFYGLCPNCRPDDS